MNRVMIEQLGKSVDLLLGDREEQKRVKFFEWINKEITIATTDGVYGPRNPYRNAAVREAFWYALGIGGLAKY